MPHLLGHTQGSRLELLHIRMAIQNSSVKKLIIFMPYESNPFVEGHTRLENPTMKCIEGIDKQITYQWHAKIPHILSC